MARIDHSIYLNQGTGDVFGGIGKGIEQGMRLSDMMRQRKQNSQDDQFNEELKSSYTADESGKLVFDKGRLGNLAKIDPTKAHAMQKQLAGEEVQARQQKQQQAMLEASEYGRIFGGVSDQSGWDSGLKEWQRLGYSGVEQMPQVFDPSFNKSVIARSMPLAEQYARQDKQKEFGYKDQELGLKKQEIAAKREENNVNKLGKTGELATKIRQERNALPVTKATQDVSAAFNKMQSAAANSSPAGDMSLIYGFMRMQDPGSTVREGEFATAQNAAGIPDQVRNAYNRALSGERLSDVQRSDFLGQAKGIYSSQMDLQKQVDGTYGQLAKDAGIDPTKVLVNFEANSGGMSQMVQMQAPDGSIRSVPQSQVQAAIAAGGKPIGGVAQNGR